VTASAGDAIPIEAVVDAPVDAAPMSVPRYVVVPERLGQRLDRGHGVVMDRPGGVRADLAACARGDGEACWDVGMAYATGQGVRVDAARAIDYATRSCAAGYAWGCLAVPAMDPGPPPDEVERMRVAGLALLDRGCTAGDGRDCAFLEELHRLGRAGVAVDADRAQTIADRAASRLAPRCDAGVVDACLQLAQVHHYALGDAARATALVRRARAIAAEGCDRGVAAACDQLGYVTADPLFGVEADRDTSVRSYARACELGWADSCVSAEGRWHERGCELGEPLSCSRAGQRARARAIYRWWCRAGDARACRDLEDDGTP
jgi:TPR repeat protein